MLKCSTRRKTTIFVDAINKCRDQDRDNLIKFFYSLKGKVQLRPNRLAACFTCRPYLDSQIDADFQIRLKDKNQDDIPKFIKQELRLLDKTETAKDKLKQLL